MRAMGRRNLVACEGWDASSLRSMFMALPALGLFLLLLPSTHAADLMEAPRPKRQSVAELWGSIGAAPPEGKPAGLSPNHPSVRRSLEPDSSGYDALAGRLRIDLDFEDQAISGRIDWTLLVTAANLEHLCFDLDDSMLVRSVDLGGICPVYTHSESLLCIHLPQPAVAGDTVVVSIEYGGRPRLGFLWSLSFDEHNGVPIAYTNCEPAGSRMWWPCKDRPDDKFTMQLTVVVPDTLIAVSNGLLAGVEEPSPGKKAYTWVERYPISTYLVSFVATNFRSFHDTYVALDSTEMPLDYYAYPEDLEAAEEKWAFTPRVIEAFARLFGEYPFLDEKYGMAEFPWPGAMENQTLTSMGEYFLRLPQTEQPVVVHELAHQWWGDWVTCGTWKDIWLNEGFATYSEALWAEWVGGPDSLKAVMQAKKRPVFHGPIYDPLFLFNSTVYNKGAWALHMLRWVVGDSLFFHALRSYGQNHAYSNATTEELRETFEEVSGMDLGWFFEEWVYGEGRPTYWAHWEPFAPSLDGPCLVRMTIWQESSGDQMFKMPLCVRFDLGEEGTFDAVLWDSLEVQTFTIETPAVPLSASLDPDGWVLCSIRFVSDPQGAETPHTLTRWALGSPRPNPAVSATSIPLLVAPDGRRPPRLLIYDLQGRIVKHLHAGSSGYLWDGLNETGMPVAGGVYLGRLEGATSPGSAVRILRLGWH